MASPHRSRRRSRSRSLEKEPRKKSREGRRKSPKKEARSDSEERKSHRKKSSRKEKKSKKSRRRSSSSGSESSDGQLERRLAAERLRSKADRAAAKERAKAAETPEEKRARRLAKKLAKESRTKADLGWGQEYLGYSNVDNPFNDPKLTQAFHWGKQLEKDGLTNLPKEEIDRTLRAKVMQSKEELEQFKRNRAEREAMKEEMEMIRRDEEMAQHQDWLKQEDVFHLKQARQRSRIRMRERRAKPIDYLARYAVPEEADSDEEEEEAELELEMHDPHHYIQGLEERDLEDLLADIAVIRKLEKTEVNAPYWADVERCAEHELARARDDESASRRRGGINPAVRPQVLAAFKGKTYADLALTETMVRQKIAKGAEGTDISYWEEFLALLKIHMAKCRLTERHQEYLKDQAKLLQKAQGLDVKPKVEGPATPERSLKPEPDEPVTAEGAEPTTIEPGEAEAAEQPEKPSSPGPEPEFKAPSEPGPSGSGTGKSRMLDRLPWSKLTEAEREERRTGLYGERSYSPSYLKESKVPATVEVLDAAQDVTNLRLTRAEKAAGRQGAEERLEAEVRKGMGNNEDEAGFAVEALTESKTYLWSDKYKPRKPRYFNRVHTGFEWNKYNQTHYDLDNPPPKIVQGYKFNIFYPDLLDPNVPPDFKLYPCDDPDFAILKFTAGPPYEDIAFKVVCREWEQDHRRGYKCLFQNGVFQLWFHFKRWRYRR